MKYVIALREGEYKKMRRPRDKTIKVVCPRCHKERTTRANFRCQCFYCGKSIKIKKEGDIL
jgi:ribosomal protein S27E